MNFKTALNLGAASITLLMVGCATTPVKGVVVVNCVSDPLTETLHCVDVTGSAYEVGWKLSGDYVCRPPLEDQKLVNASRER